MTVAPGQAAENALRTEFTLTGLSEPTATTSFIDAKKGLIAGGVITVPQDATRLSTPVQVLEGFVNYKY